MSNDRQHPKNTCPYGSRDAQQWEAGYRQGLRGTMRCRETTWAQHPQFKEGHAVGLDEYRRMLETEG